MPDLRVLIVKLSSLGDVVHAIPALQDIRQAHPGAAIDWVIEPAFAPVLRRVEGLASIIELPLRRWRKTWWQPAVRDEMRHFVSALRARRYDTVLDLQGLTKSALVARIARGRSFGLANRTEGSSFEAPARWLVDRAVRVEPHIHALDRSREIAARSLGYAFDARPRFGLRGHPAGDATQTLVAVHGASRADKLWPEADWIALGRRAVAQGWRLALPRIGAAEHARAQRIAQGVGAGAQVWPEMALDALVDRMAAAVGVIGVDSGLSHIAVALGLPHVQIYFAPTSWRTGPQPSHGRADQASVEACGGVVTVDAVWEAWLGVTSRYNDRECSSASAP